MWPFKKKKIYRVRYMDRFEKICITVVKAVDEEQACRAIEEHYPYAWYVTQIIEIEEIKQ